MSEKAFQSQLMLALSQLPRVRVWRQNVGIVETADRRFFHAGPPKGAADISGIVAPEGWRLEVECKAGKGKRSPEQIAWAAFIQLSGGVYYVAHESFGSEHCAAAIWGLIANRRMQKAVA
jgi:hypothetical protein